MKIKHLFIDLFCGAGGTSSGIYKAMLGDEMIAEVVACVNHDKNAIMSHKANFPNALHMTEDIRTVALAPIIEALMLRKEQLEALGYKVLVHLWASLECTNFSRAKGGESRDADSRTLAEHLFRYIDSLKPDYIWIENVQEFMEWGPLCEKELELDLKKDIHFPHCPLKIVKDKKGKRKTISFNPVMIPVKERLAEFYNAWIENIKACGYNHEYRILNSADFGERTSRKRYFGQFVSNELPLKWPKPTHSKNPERTLFGQPLPKWKAVKECLDFDNEGQSIFTRKKDLSKKTLQRIYAGLIKYIAGGKESFLTKMYSSHNNTKVNAGADIDKPSPTITTYVGMNLVQPEFMLKYNSVNKETGNHIPPSVNDPCPTIACQARLGIVQTKFLSKYYSGDPDNKNQSINDPAGTIRTKDTFSLIQAFITKYYSEGGQLSNIEDPAGTITTKDRMSLIQPTYLVNYHHSSDVNSVDEPNPTVTTKDKFALVQPKYWLDKQYSGSENHQSIEQPGGTILGNDKHYLMSSEHFIDKQYSEGGRNQSIEAPAGSLTTVPKMSLVKCWIMNTNFDNVGSSIEEPNPTITANRKQHYLINPAWGGNPGDIDLPCCTIVARQDKAPLYFVMVESIGPVAIGIYEEDCEDMIKIKEFMALYGIVDIKMRMLLILELLKIQGFDEDYTLIGTKTEQKKYIGNSVTPLIVKHLIEAANEALINHFEKIAA